MDTRDPGFPERFRSLVAYEDATDVTVLATVQEIIAAIRQCGDAALCDYTRRFDRHEVVSAAALELPRERLTSAVNDCDVRLCEALLAAAARIRRYHEHQRIEPWSIGVLAEGASDLFGQRVTPLERVGVYVPGGKAAYPSTVLMNAIPAKIAGVGEVIMAVPAPGGEIDPIVLAAAGIAGVDRVFTIGGAQAIAALAYGTETVPSVDKIVGPGNRYVAAAKAMVFGRVGIDLIAGPSEVVIVSDGMAPAEWVTMDLFAQAEHDAEARAILLCPDPDFIEAVVACLERELPGMERAAIIGASLSGRGALIRVRDLEEALRLANTIAPEHLELAVADPEAWLPKVRHAGAIFLGCHAAGVLGDYCAGPNHVLPTAGTARFSSPLGVYDFQKRSSVIRCSVETARELGGIASLLARAEGLTAHARAAECRLAEAGRARP
ncbi:MAG: histidinol dehydrogenase [Beggiatoa sp.]|nr:histidinol dehydrogenase [Beggiatoa sp.]